MYPVCWSRCIGVEQEGKLFVLGTLGGSGHKHRHTTTPETKMKPRIRLPPDSDPESSPT